MQVSTVCHARLEKSDRRLVIFYCAKHVHYMFFISPQTQECELCELEEDLQCGNVDDVDETFFDDCSSVDNFEAGCTCGCRICTLHDFVGSLTARHLFVRALPSSSIRTHCTPSTACDTLVGDRFLVKVRLSSRSAPLVWAWSLPSPLLAILPQLGQVCFL